MTAADFNDYMSRLEDDLEGPFTMSWGIIPGIVGGLVIWALIGLGLAVILAKAGGM